jgi:predicted DNA-binding transcriptional regulator AlpA
MKKAVRTHSFEKRFNSRDIEAITGKHRQTIWRWINATPPLFPKPSYVNGFRSWTESQIAEWEAQSIQTFEERRGGNDE